MPDFKKLHGNNSNNRKLHQLLEIKREDVKYPFYLRGHSTDLPTYWQVFTLQDYDFLTEVPPKIIVDAGANIGLASIYFANKFPEAKIISIEPESTNFEMLKKNVAAYKTIIPVQAALWNNNRLINLIDPGGGNWGYMTENASPRGDLLNEPRHQVQAITVDKLMEDQGLDKIDIF